MSCRTSCLRCKTQNTTRVHAIDHRAQDDPLLLLALTLRLAAHRVLNLRHVPQGRWADGRDLRLRLITKRYKTKVLTLRFLAITRCRAYVLPRRGYVVGCFV